MSLISLACSNVSCSIDKKKILNHVDFVADTHHFTAVIGSSGSGKTTFLEALSGRVESPKVLRGEFMLNGNEIDSAGRRNHIRYLSRKEHLLPHITVEETFETTARLTLPELTQQERSERIHAVLQKLGLLECRHTLIGGGWRKGLSSGEQRRVQIGQLLLSDTKLLVLDDPTTGLDTYSSLRLMSVLKTLAHSGCMVICSFQQPSSVMLSLVDHLLVLSNGFVIYSGKVEDSRHYFTKLGIRCPKGFSILNDVLSFLDNDSLTFTSKSDVHSVSVSSSPHSLSFYLSSLVPGFSTTSNIDVDSSSNHISASFDQVLPIDILPKDTGVPSFTQHHASAPQRPSLHFLVEKYKNSQSYSLILERLEHERYHTSSPSLVLSSAVQHHELSTFFRPANLFKSFKTLRYQVPSLFMRFFINNLRCPIVYLLIFLMHLIQGVFLGETQAVRRDLGPKHHGWWLGFLFLFFLGIIFWNVAKRLDNQTPWNLSVTSLNSSPWTSLLTHQPFLDTLNLGVDGNLSQPLSDFFSNTERINLVHSLISCASLYQQFLDNYPSFGVGAQDDWDSPERLKRSTKPREGVYNMITLLQTAHYLKSQVESVKSPDELWSTLYAASSESILNPYIRCIRHLKVLSDPSPDLPSEKDTFTKLPPKKRLLLPADTLNLYDLLHSSFGAILPKLIYSTHHYLKHMKQCTHALCNVVDRLTSKIKRFWSDLLLALGTLINVCGCLFFVTATLGFSSFDALLVFIQQRRMFYEERANGLYTSASYFVARNLSDLPFQIIPSLIFVSVFYIMAGFGHTISHYFIYLLACLGITFAAYGFEYLVSSVCPSVEIALLTAPIILVIWLTLSGFMLREEMIPFWLRWFNIFNFYKWGFYALMVNQFPLSSNSFFGVLPHAFPRMISGVFNVTITESLVRLYAIGFLFRILAFQGLLFSLHQKKTYSASS